MARRWRKSRSTRSPASTGCSPWTSCTTSGTRSTPRIDRGQIEGGFIQGYGWLAMEELWWNDEGRAEDATRRPRTRSRPRTTCRRTSTSTSSTSRTARRRSTAPRPSASRRSCWRCRRSRRCATRSPASAATGLSPRLDAPATDERILRRRSRTCARAQAAWLTGCARWTLAARGARDGRAVLVTVAHARGLDAARGRRGDGRHARSDSFGTIGGGHLEFEALRIARDALASDATPPAPGSCAFRWRRGSGQCCGGVATLAFTVDRARTSTAGSMPPLACAAHAYAVRTGHAHRRRDAARADARHRRRAHRLARRRRPRLRGDRAGARAALTHEPRRRELVPPPTDGADAAGARRVVPRDFHVLLFGNGHVGRALVQVLGALPASVRWIDGREHDFPAQVPRQRRDRRHRRAGSRTRACAAGAYVVVADAQPRARLRARRGRAARATTGATWGSSARRRSATSSRSGSPRAACRPTSSRASRARSASQRLAIRSKEPGAIAVAVAAEIARAARSAAQRRSAVHGATAQPAPRAPTSATSAALNPCS